MEVYGVEPAVADDWARSIEAGGIRRIPAAPTVADGLRSLEPGRVPFPVVRELVRGIIRVAEEEILAAMGLLLTRAKVVAEPSGAVSVAGALFHGEPFRGRRVVAVVSGGNVDPGILARLPEPDPPGERARMAERRFHVHCPQAGLGGLPAARRCAGGPDAGCVIIVGGLR